MSDRKVYNEFETLDLGVADAKTSQELIEDNIIPLIIVLKEGEDVYQIDDMNAPLHVKYNENSYEIPEGLNVYVYEYADEPIKKMVKNGVQTPIKETIPAMNAGDLILKDESGYEHFVPGVIRDTLAKIGVAKKDASSTTSSSQAKK